MVGLFVFVGDVILWMVFWFGDSRWVFRVVGVLRGLTESLEFEGYV